MSEQQRSSEPSASIQSVLLIGSNGFLGKTIPDRIVTRHPNCKVTLLDIAPKSALDYPYHRGDITNLSSLLEIFDKVKPQVVIHSATPPITTVGQGSEKLYFSVNVEGTRNVIKACNETGVTALVYTSSASVIYDGGDLINANEKQPYATKHVDAYNASKTHADRLVLEANSPTLHTCTLRPSAMFGPGDRTIVPGLYHVIKNRQTLWQIGDNSNLWDFTYVDNIAHAHVLAAENLITPEDSLPQGSAAGEAFMITNGEPVYFWDFARACWAAWGHVNPRKIAIPMSLGYWLGLCSELFSTLLRREPGLTRFRVMTVSCARFFDIRKARRVLAYEPIVGLTDGVTRACKAYVDAGVYTANAPPQS